ncbi:LysR family transcriptional regulator [Shewanella surugensis]|uniref:LysR family transcriptional regulator n=1 Tax=Shewanella surugensis TaxID=212020 RepID=A0ABT0LEV7_9GAMM|nr:LysR family transcriptional regulator [Shewanella surugensis]MCL1125862.1 LysR family transcriptional regulator [Shewanella surugensis]
MDKLKSMQALVKVVEQGSFAKAAARLSITSTMVGKHVKALELGLGVKLLNRTTRKQSLTEAGERYYFECRRLLAEIAETENSLQQFNNEPKGIIRINSPVTFGHKVLTPIVAAFLQAYPNINIELILDNGFIDPLHDPFDLIIRIGDLVDSSLIGRTLGDYEMIFCASPSYLSQAGSPDSLNALLSHACLGFHYGDVKVDQALRHETLAFDPSHTRLTSNSGEALKVAALAGAGIILQPRLLLSECIEKGVLIEVLPHSAPKPLAINLLYKSPTQPLKTRTFITFIVDALS